MNKPVVTEEIQIKILPNNGDFRQIGVNVAKMALTLKDMIESTGEPLKDDSQPVPLPSLSAEILDKVIEYLNYHFNDPIEEKDSEEEDNNDIKRSDDISDWDRNFMKDMDHNTLFDLIQAANYLCIKGLLDIGCKTAANQIKGKTAEEVRELWGIECDLSPEDMEKLRLENSWAEEN